MNFVAWHLTMMNLIVRWSVSATDICTEKPAIAKSIEPNFVWTKFLSLLNFQHFFLLNFVKLNLNFKISPNPNRVIQSIWTTDNEVMLKNQITCRHRIHWLLGNLLNHFSSTHCKQINRMRNEKNKLNIIVAVVVRHHLNPEKMNTAKRERNYYQ